MQPYRDWDKDSNITAYEEGPDYIKINFKGGHYHLYTYTYASASPEHVEIMKQFARAGDGLNAYVNEHRPKYSERA